MERKINERTAEIGTKHAPILFWLRARQNDPHKMVMTVEGLEPQLAEQARQRVAERLEESFKAAYELNSAPTIVLGPRAACCRATEWLKISIPSLSSDAAYVEDVKQVVRAAVEDALGADFVKTRNAELHPEAVHFSAMPPPGDEIKLVLTLNDGSVVTDPPWWKWVPEDPNNPNSPSVIVWVPPPAPNTAWSIGIRLDNSYRDYGELDVSYGDSNDAYPLECAVTFKGNDCAWAKEIYAFNAGVGMVSLLHQEGKSYVPSTMVMSQNTSDTLVFRKPGFLGVWYDAGHFEINAFWYFFRGTRLDFIWRFD